MKKKSIILYIIIGLVVAISATATYFYFKKSPNKNIWDYVPHDATFVIETNNLTNGWKTMSESEIWQHLMTCKLFEEINSQALTADSLIKDNETLDMLFDERPLLISCHPLENNDFDFLFTIDLKQAGKFSFLKKYLKGIVGVFDYEMDTEKYENEDLIILSNTKDENDKMYISIIENVFSLSFNKKIIENSIDAGKNEAYWDNNNNFSLVKNKTSRKSLFRFYVNYEYLSGFLKFYFEDQNELLDEMKRIFTYSAFDVDFENTKIEFDGYTKLSDSCNSYINLLSDISPGEMTSQNIVPNNAAILMSITFENYMDLFNKLKEGFAFSEPSNAENYEKSISRIEKYFSIDLEEDFFSWIGNEICLIKLEPGANSNEDDAAIAIHSSDMEKTIEGLNKICKKIRGRTPIKIKDSEYNGHVVKYFAIKDFFKLFFGKMFAKIEKPYFTYIDNFVVFSNNSSCLMDFIDASQNKKTLQNNEDFSKFMESFDNEANVTIYVNGPRVYKHLYYFSQEERKKSISENKEVIVSFKNLCFQLSSKDKNYFESKIIVEHSKDALYDAELEKIENTAEQLYINEYDTLIEIELPETMEDEKTVRIYWEDDSTKIKAEGKTKDGKKEGNWRYYYESGNIWATMIFEENKVQEKAILFYDTETPKMKAQIEYKDGKIEGTYKEYYENGERKCQIEYEDNLAEGKAEFFYDSGMLKIEGEYKEGIKKGKWKHYSEIGDLMNKEKWKKNKQNN